MQELMMLGMQQQQKNVLDGNIPQSPTYCNAVANRLRFIFNKEMTVC